MHVKIIRKKKDFAIYLYILFTVFYTWFAIQLPYTHDDWCWGSPYGMFLWLTAPLNNRFAGNFFVILMTHSRLLKPIIMGIFYFLLPYSFSTLACKSLSSKHKGQKILFFLVCQCLLLTMERGVLQQTYTWVSGFANFVISTVFLVFWFYEIRLVFAEKICPDNISFPFAMLLFVLALIGQLFVENITIFTLFLSLYICLVRYIRIKKIYKRDFALLSGSFIGCLLMFSSHMYSSLWSTGTAIDGYREILLITSSGVTDLIKRIFAQTAYLIPNIYTNNLIICETILLLLSCLLICNNKKLRICQFVLCLINCIVMVFLWWNHSYSGSNADSLLLQIVANDMLLSLIYFLLVTTEIVYLFYSNKQYMCYLLTIWLSVLCIQAPLVVTTAYGGRLFFVSCALSILFALILLQKLTEVMTSVTVTVLMYMCLFVTILLSVSYGLIFAENHACEIEREAIIAEAIQSGDNQIELPLFPHREYLVSPEPVNAMWDSLFKLYYGLPDHVELTFK